MSSGICASAPAEEDCGFTEGRLLLVKRLNVTSASAHHGPCNLYRRDDVLIIPPCHVVDSQRLHRILLVAHECPGREELHEQRWRRLRRLVRPRLALL